MGKLGKMGYLISQKSQKSQKIKNTKKKGITDMNNITDIKRTLLILKNHGVNKINIRCIGK